jgi:MarR family transcriptional regulator, organic hydroperoxide resistance regulator
MVDRGPRKAYSSSVATKAGREVWRIILRIVFERGSEPMHDVSSEEGLSPAQLKTLFHLEPGQGWPMRDLADHWRCDPSYVTSLADALEARGLVERRPHPSDRRVKMIALTRKGIVVRDRAFDQVADRLPALSALSASEQRMLRDLLRKLARAEAQPSRLAAAR